MKHYQAEIRFHDGRGIITRDIGVGTLKESNAYWAEDEQEVDLFYTFLPEEMADNFNGFQGEFAVISSLFQGEFAVNGLPEEASL